MKTQTLASILLALTLSACMVGPDYVRPEFNIPETYKETPAGWKIAEPADLVPRGHWWNVYNDKTLNVLVEQVAPSNQNIQAYVAAYRQAQAMAAQAGSARYPSLGANASKTRTRSAGNGTISGGNKLTLDARWEIDLWGGVRRGVEAADANTQASAAQLAATTLSAQATLVQDYFQLRVIDMQRKLVAQTVQVYAQSLALAQNKFAVGMTTPSDVAQAQSQLKSAQATAFDLDLSRSQFEHAIAILMGKAPAQFQLPEDPSWEPFIPVIPLQVSSHLLERRPDVAAAERAAASANAKIGVARAAYYPSLSLSGSVGYQSGDLADWFNAPGRVWSIGASMAQFIFDGGKRRSIDEQAQAVYDQSVAKYKQTVLGALQEVEDNLAALHYLREEIIAQNDAVTASLQAQQLAQNQYKAGTADFLSVASTQRALLSAQRSALQLSQRQLSASVLLIKALGGGWEGRFEPKVESASGQ